MLKIVANAILLGKMNYHMIIWPLINNANLNKVNKIIENVARTIYGYDNYGRTTEFILQKIKWFKIQEMHHIAISKFIHKLLNNDDNHYLKDLITTNRQNKTLADNKIGTLQDNIGISTLEQKTLIYKAQKIYNNLPREITLIKKKSNFKKWIIKYYLNKNIKFTKILYDYNVAKDVSKFNIDKQNNNDCFNQYELS